MGEGAVVEPVTAARCAGGLPVTARQNGALVLPLAAQVCTKQGLQKLQEGRVNEEPRLALKWFIFHFLVGKIMHSSSINQSLCNLLLQKKRFMKLSINYCQHVN